MAWLGRKKLAFIPLTRTNIDTAPPDWNDLILQRLLFNPALDPKTGAPIPGTDRSVRAYFQAVSSGQAGLDVAVLPAQTIAETNVPPDALDSTMGAQLKSEGYNGGAIVFPGGACGETTVNTSFNWTRICMGDPLGNWVGELLHNQCNLPDLFDYAGDDNMEAFDQEAGYDATHISAWTKRAVGWLDPSAVALHSGGVIEYILHSASLIQPPPPGRVTAVQIGSQVPYLMVEARLKADQFDINIPNEGVIVYRVQTTDPLGNSQNEIAPLALLTKNALTVGQSFQTDGVTISVDSTVLGGGFSIEVSTVASGQLLSYGDTGVSDPVIVGFGGWQAFQFLFAGQNLAGENRIYAVNQAGQLLSYGDDTNPGNVSAPVIVGNDDWLTFKFLFAGQNLQGQNCIYAVKQGQLLSYADDGTPGNVSNPVAVGGGDWLDLNLMFAGTNFSGQNRIYGVNQNGQLLSYEDNGSPGAVWGRYASLGGWNNFKFLVAGKNLSGDNRIYAVNQSGQLLSYGSSGIPGNVSAPTIIGVNQIGELLSYGSIEIPASISDPAIVGFGGWQAFKFLFAGQNLAGVNRIYAVNQSGQLLSYGDDTNPGNVSAPVIVGNDDWLNFKFLFAGRNLSGVNRIYAVNQAGQLLSYGDDANPGNVSAPVIVGNDDWLNFKFLFAGENLSGDNRIYAVNQSGQLLSYVDDGTAGNVSNPVTVGFGGWLNFKFLFAGKNLSGVNRIYAVVA